MFSLTTWICLESLPCLPWDDETSSRFVPITFASFPCFPTLASFTCFPDFNVVDIKTSSRFVPIFACLVVLTIFLVDEEDLLLFSFAAILRFLCVCRVFERFRCELTEPISANGSCFKGCCFDFFLAICDTGIFSLFWFFLCFKRRLRLLFLFPVTLLRLTWLRLDAVLPISANGSRFTAFLAAWLKLLATVDDDDGRFCRFVPMSAKGSGLSFLVALFLLLLKFLMVVVVVDNGKVSRFDPMSAKGSDLLFTLCVIVFEFLLVFGALFDFLVCFSVFLLTFWGVMLLSPCPMSENGSSDFLVPGFVAWPRFDGSADEAPISAYGSFIGADFDNWSLFCPAVSLLPYFVLLLATAFPMSAYGSWPPLKVWRVVGFDDPAVAAALLPDCEFEDASFSSKLGILARNRKGFISNRRFLVSGLILSKASLNFGKESSIIEWGLLGASFGASWLAAVICSSADAVESTVDFDSAPFAGWVIKVNPPIPWDWSNTDLREEVIGTFPLFFFFKPRVAYGSFATFAYKAFLLIISVAEEDSSLFSTFLFLLLDRRDPISSDLLLLRRRAGSPPTSA